MTFQDRNIENKTYEEQLILEATLQNKSYSYNKIEPSAFFWKELTATSGQSPLCLVPDTLVLNQKDMQLMWIYTDQTGHIRKQTNINFKDFIAKITSYSSPNQLVAILKRPIFNEKLTYTNDFKLFNSRYLLNCSQQQLGQKEQVLCLQRFVKSNGSKPFLCRTVYRINNCSECYLITNTRNFYDKNQPENKKFIVKAGDKSTIVKSKQGKNLQETQKYLSQIVKYMKFFRGIEITELVGDFIKDQAGNWWLLNIKAFNMKQKIKKDGVKSKNIVHTSQELEKERYQKTKMCRYCQKSYLESQLTFKMTMRMIIEVDKYLLHLGKQYNWLKRSDIANIDSNILYQQHKVCERCFKLYSEIQDLMQLERKFLIKQGCQLIAHPKQLIFSQTNQDHLRLQAKNKQIHRLQHGIPQMIQLGPNTNITIKNECPIKNDQIINKMIRFRFIIFLNEIDEVVDVNPHCNYYLQYTFFNRKHKYKLNTSMVHQKIIPLNKLKIFYFFSNSIESLEQQYCASSTSFKMQIITEHKQTQQKRTIGKLQLPFKDLIVPINRKKDFYKFFHIEKVAYGWGLEGSIGIIPSDGEVTTAKISFEKSEGLIYIPNQNYYFCEPLTEEWFDLIKAKNQKALNQRCYVKSNKLSVIKQKDMQSFAAPLRSSEISNSMISRADIEQQKKLNPLNQIKVNKQQNKNGDFVSQFKETDWKNLLQKEIDIYQNKSIKRVNKISKKVQRSNLYSDIE